MIQHDYATARDHMVDGQVRPNKVIDPRIIRAMRRLPRERFVTPQAVSLAYADEDVPLGRGRFLMEPMVIARLVQLARVRDGDRVLVIGAGTGYGACLMAACGGEVTALEEDPALLAIMRPLLAELAPTVQIVEGKLAEGRLDGTLPDGRWSVIMIEGSVQAIPPGLAAQVRHPEGRLVTVLSPPSGRGQGGSGVLAEPSGAGLRAHAEFDCQTPLLPQLVAPPVFQF